MRISASRLLAAATLLALTGLGLAGPATAASSRAAVTADPVSAGAGWLTTQFAGSTHLPTPGGDHFDQVFGGKSFPNYGESADVVFGLAAAKSGGAKLATALRYLAHHVDAYADIKNSDGYGPYDGSLGKLAVAAIVGGADPTDFGGYNLMKQLRTDECPSATTSCTPGQAANTFASISEAYVLLAQARAGATYAPTAQAVDYFLSLQCANGGFTDKTTKCGSGAADVDSTSYAIMALTAVGGHADAVSKAAAWLTSQQKKSAYWISQGVPNVNSTGLAAAALAGTGADVTRVRTWLLGQQLRRGSAAAGAFAYAAKFTPTGVKSGTSPSVLATAQALPALVAGGGLATLRADGIAAGASLFAPSLRVWDSRVAVGTKQSATAAGFAAGEVVTASIHSTPKVLGRARAAADGTVHFAFTVPALASGSHLLSLTGATTGLSATRALSVAPAPTPAGSSTSAAGASSGVVPIAATGIDARRLVGLGSLAVVLVALGAALQVAARRREH